MVIEWNIIASSFFFLFFFSWTYEVEENLWNQLVWKPDDIQNVCGFLGGLSHPIIGCLLLCLSMKNVWLLSFFFCIVPFHHLCRFCFLVQILLFVQINVFGQIPLFVQILLSCADSAFCAVPPSSRKSCVNSCRGTLLLANSTCVQFPLFVQILLFVQFPLLCKFCISSLLQ